MVTALSGAVATGDEQSFNAIAERAIPGRSRQRLATPVRLPLERTLPGPVTDWVMLTARGNNEHEYELICQSLPAEGYRHAEWSGRACRTIKPWFLLANRRTGQGLAMMLAYMGNWTFAITPRGPEIVVRLDTTPTGLPPFQTIHGLPIPGALVAEFTGHWDYGAQPIVRFIREKLLRDMGPNWPPVEYDDYFAGNDGHQTEAILLEQVPLVAELGFEVFLVDCGWYGDADEYWMEMVGDWRENRVRLPNGLGPVAEAVHRHGLKFGLWFEIERARLNTPLAQAHPEWLLTDAKGQRYEPGVLDFGNPAVVAFAKSTIDGFVTKYRLDWIKLDFNTDIPVESDQVTAATSPLYRHYRGLAELLTYLRRRHPTLIIENCSSGSLRQELTAVALTDTHWVSDNFANNQNLIQNFGVTYLFPPAICLHWTCRPDRVNNQYLDLNAQFLISLLGHAGTCGNLSTWDPDIRAITKQHIAQYKRLRPLLRTADVFHLTQQRLGAVQAALYVDETSGRALLFAFQGGDPKLEHQIRLRGLDPRRRYHIQSPPGFTVVASAHGEDLLKQGLSLRFPQTGSAVVLEIEPTSSPGA